MCFKLQYRYVFHFTNLLSIHKYHHEACLREIVHVKIILDTVCSRILVKLKQKYHGHHLVGQNSLRGSKTYYGGISRFLMGILVSNAFCLKFRYFLAMAKAYKKQG